MGSPGSGAGRTIGCANDGTATYLRDGFGDLLGQQAGKKGSVDWYITDALSSIYGTTNASGNLGKDTTDYSDYGVQLTDTNLAFGYTGERTDMSANGLVNFYARGYLPSMATWVQADPSRGGLSSPSTLQRHRYVSSNPVWARDRLGNFAWIPFILVVVAIVGVVTSVNEYNDASRAEEEARKQPPSPQRDAEIQQAETRKGVAVVTGVMSVIPGGTGTVCKILCKGPIAKIFTQSGARSVAYSATNRAEHELLKDGLRASMQKPFTRDPALTGLMDDLYRPGAQVGSGSTAAAVRQELATGIPVGGVTGHVQKAENYVRALEKWLRDNPTATPGDRAAAENVIRDLTNALNGR